MTLSVAERGRRWRAVGVLYAGNVLRFIVNMALVQLIVLWAERRAETRAALEATSAEIGLLGSNINGPLQAAMQVGMGAAGLTAGIVLRSHHEKGALIAVPCAGALAVAAFPLASLLDPGGTLDPGIALAFLLAVLAGAGYGGMIPVTMSLAQRLLPHRTSLASGLMLGGAWCFGALGPPMASVLTNGVGSWGGVGLDWAFVGIGGVLLVSGVVATGLHGETVRGAGEERTAERT
jgi:MFS family permease